MNRDLPKIALTWFTAITLPFYALHAVGATSVDQPPISIAKLESSAKLGYGPSQYKLGLAYAAGDGVLQNLPEAAYWWRKAAHNLCAPAELQLGSAYAHGWGVYRNPDKAIYWWKQAAKNGNREIAEKARLLLDKAV